MAVAILEFWGIEVVLRAYKVKGGEVHSNLGSHDTFLKIVSLLQNYMPERGKRMHVWKALCTGFPKIPTTSLS